MSEKKVVSRNVALALGIICLFMVAGLAGAFSYYIIDKNDMISSLNSQVSQLNTNAKNLQSRINEFTSILSLDKSIVLGVWQNTLILPHSYATVLASLDSPPYAGYVSVEVNESTSPATYIEVIFESHGVHYHNKVVIGTTGTELFPVLPSIIIRIRVGTDSPNTETVNRITLTYYY